MHVLLVEPDKILGDTLKTAFEAGGYEVVLKRSAQTALDSLDIKIPDLIVLELQLGIHNGVEFLYEIRSYLEWQAIPVIVHTINVKALNKIFGPSLKQLGVQTVLYKPRTSTAQLLRVIKQLTLVL